MKSQMISTGELTTRATMIKKGEIMKSSETSEQYLIRYEHWQNLLDIGFWSEFPIPAPQIIPYSMPITDSLPTKGIFVI